MCTQGHYDSLEKYLTGLGLFTTQRTVLSPGKSPLFLGSEKWRVIVRPRLEPEKSCERTTLVKLP